MDLMSNLSRQRIIYIGERITDTVATSVCAKLLALEAINPEAEIQIYINSGGGIPYAVFAIFDTMNIVKCPIRTVAVGAVMSQSVLILANGTKGRRHGMRNARIMMHQPQGGMEGPIYDVKRQANELNRIWRTIQAMLVDLTGLSLYEVEIQTDRDTYMSSEQAVAQGVLDGVVD